MFAVIPSDKAATRPLISTGRLNVESFRPPTGNTTDEAIPALHRHRWPGNVRELQTVIERAVLFGKGGVIGLDDLPSEMTLGGPINVPQTGGRTLKDALAGPERQIILEVLEVNNWNRHETAESLGINRTTLYKKMKRLGLEDVRHVAT